MLSPGKWNEWVPREWRLNLRKRDVLLAYADRGEAERAALWQMCKEDILYYINVFVWQFNPNKLGDELGVFVTWEFQEAAIRELLGCVEEGEDAVIEKSREMGATWICAIIFDWLGRFHDWKKFLVVSRNADAVDKPDDTDSVFWKLDHLNRYLPGWLQAGRTRKKMLIVYERTNSQIAGTASTGLAGVSGRSTAIFVDEFSVIKEDTEVRQGTASTSKCRIFNGTHRGTGTEFNKMCQQVDLKKIRMHWTQHPDKVAGLYRSSSPVEVLDKKYQFAEGFKFVMDGSPVGGPRPGIRSPWYDAQCAKIGNSRGVAMDLDINPEGSVSQVFDPLVIRELQETYGEDPCWRGTIVYDRDTGEEPELVASPGGLLKLWVKPRMTSKGLVVPRGRYSAGGDVATGTGSTPSCLSIALATGDGAGRKVAEYANAHIPVDDFAVFAVALCRLFKDENGTPALFAWEVPGPGLRFGIKVLMLGYRRIYYNESNFAGLVSKVSTVPGWWSNPQSKRVLIEGYMAGLSNREFENRSREALAETLRFEYKKAGGGLGHANEESKDDPAGARVNHGDLVIADALAYKMMKTIWVPAPEDGQADVEHPHPGSLAGRRALQAASERQELNWGW